MIKDFGVVNLEDSKRWDYIEVDSGGSGSDSLFFDRQKSKRYIKEPKRLHQVHKKYTCAHQRKNTKTLFLIAT